MSVLSIFDLGFYAVDLSHFFFKMLFQKSFMLGLVFPIGV